MFFAKKTKGFCVDFGDQAILLARMSQEFAPLVVEEVREFGANDTDALKAFISTTDGKGPTGYAHATVGINPPRRLVRRHTIDVKRLREPAYFSEVLSQQFRVEAEKYSTRVLNPDDGSDFDTTKTNQKEVIFCGLPSDEIITWQDRMLSLSIYPERLELSSIATLGGLVSYLKFKQSKSPVLLLEMGDDATQSFILSADGVDISRPIPSGITAMIPVVQKELGLKDEESAKKLFYSNTFDFTSMGGTLIKKLLKELQSSIGFYEVQTGQSIGSVLCTGLPPNLSWLAASIAQSLGVGVFKLELIPWLDSVGIKLADGVSLTPPDERWLSLFSLMVSHHNVAEAATEQKK
jgi:hypothetical protein